MSEGKGNWGRSHLLARTDMSSVQADHNGRSCHLQGSTWGHKQMLGTVTGKKKKKFCPANIYNLQCQLAKQSWQSNRHTPTSERQRAWAGPREGPQGWGFSSNGNGAGPYRTPAPLGRESGPHRHGTTTFHSDLNLLFSEQVGKLRPHWKGRRKSNTSNNRMETSVCFLHGKTREHVRAWCIIIIALEKFWGYRQQPFPQVWEWVWASSFSSRWNSEVVQSRGWKAKSQEHAHR